MQPGNKKFPKLTKQTLHDLQIICKYMINKLHINTFAKIIIITDVLCEACFSGAHLCKEFIITFYALLHSTILEW